MLDSSSARKALHAASHARLAFAAMMASNLCLAFGPWLVRLADVGPAASAFWRLALAAPVLLLLTRVTGQPIRRMPGAMWALLALSGLFFAADLASWHFGILHTKLANATLFGNSTAFMLPLYGMVVARMRPGRNEALALSLAVIGVILLLGRSYELSPRNFGGDLLCILAGIFYTGYIVAMGHVRDTLSPWPTLTLATLSGILPLLIFALVMGGAIVPQNWTPVLLLAMVSQVVGQGLMIYAVGHLPPMVLGLGLLAQPVVAALIGWLAYAERLGPLDLVGAVAIGVALVLVRRPDPVRPAPAG